jgi:hypothetical protein
MIKKIALGGIFVLASVLTFSTATAASTQTKLVHGGAVTVPHSPVGQGMCGHWGC